MTRLTNITEEIVDHRPFMIQDAQEMAFYIQQTLDRFSDLSRHGYLAMESAYLDDSSEWDFYTFQFDPDNSEHQSIIDSGIRYHLEAMVKFIQASDKDKFIADNDQYFNGVTMGGLEDFNFSTLPVIYSAMYMMENGVLEVPMRRSISSMPLLPLHFFAELKLHFGSLHAKDCPQVTDYWDLLIPLDIHPDHFNFRELTLLAGYKTERSIRNLAYKEASKNKKGERGIATFKDKGATLITTEEVKRWLALFKK